MADLEHSPKGASQAKRNCMCPGSYWLCKAKASDPTSSSYAEEGTLAHTLAENKLKYFLAKRRGDERYWAHDLFSLPNSKHIIKGVEYTVTQEMLNALNVYVNLVKDYIDDYGLNDDDILIEKKVYIPHPITDELWGSPDCQLVIPMYKLVVIDYKHGAGVPVSVEYNFQLMFYALAAFLSLPLNLRQDLVEVEMIIVQPRTDSTGDGVKRSVISTDKLLEFEKTLSDMCYHVDIAEENPYAFLNPGYDWCRFCAAKAECPALRNKIETDIGVPLTDASDVEPKSLSPQQLAKWLDVMKDIMSLAKAVGVEAWVRASKGVTIPGYKLEDNLGDREWDDVAKAEETFKGVIPIYEPQPSKLLSPTQVEDKLKDLRGKTDNTDPKWKILTTDLKGTSDGGLVIRKVKGTKLVKDKDYDPDKPASKFSDFDAIDISKL